MASERVLELVAMLARDSAARRQTAAELARYLNAHDLIVLIPEKEHSFFLPASGFPQTLPRGKSWRAFTAEVTAKSFAATEIGYPTAGNRRTARGWSARDGAILILFDGEPNLDGVHSVLALLPLITPGFEKERIAITSAAHARISAQAAQQAREMAEALDAVRRQLQATVILREKDISERQRIEAELERSNLSLQRVNDDLNQFTFAATHDVREPLRMITIYVQLLQKEFGGQLSSPAHSYIQQVVKGAQRISRLIDGLLQFTRMGAMLPVEPAPVRCQAALEEALADLEISLKESGAKVTHDDLPSAMADHLHVRQLFQNLVGNAIKYRRPKEPPEIRISAKRDGGQWLFAVADNGIGISPEHYEQVFVPFRRLHGPEISGAGIGLATCKRIVERYGGRIWVESGEHRGCVFQFSLAAAEGATHAGP